jgi:SNF2 family DNA or RNA helicase
MSKSIPLPRKPFPPSKAISPAGGSSFSGLPWVPAEYQMEAAKFLVSKACAGLCLDPGLRKTSVVLAVLLVLMRRKLAAKTLVIAPPRVCRSVWPDEVQKWADFQHLRVVNLHGEKKDQLLSVDADIYLVSWNSLDWMFDVTKKKNPKTGKVSITVNMDKVKALGINVLVADEISKARNPNSLSFKVLKEAREHFDRIYGMTGSLSPKSLLDLFGVMYIIDGGYSLGAYITHYRNAFFYQTGYGGFSYALQDGAEKKIYKKISPFLFRLDAKDLIKLPKLVENVVPVDLPPAARRVYDEMEEEMFTQIDEQGIAAINGGSAYGKCRQIANGGLYKNFEVDGDGARLKGPREWADLHDEKTEAVMDMVEELNGAPALVVYDFHHDLARLKKGLGEKTPHIGGGVSAREGDRIIRLWNDGKVPVLLVHAAAMSHGLNMQGSHAQHVLWHSLTDNYEAYDQLIRRILRSGNDAPTVFSHLFVAKDTVDELMVKRGIKKAATQSDLNKALKEYTLKRRRRPRNK